MAHESIKWNGPAPEKWRGERITIGHRDDWTVIFFGDEQVHWHDTPCIEQMLRFMGIGYDVIDIDEYERANDYMPDTLTELKKVIDDEKRQKLLDEKAALEAKIAALDRQLGS